MRGKNVLLFVGVMLGVIMGVAVLSGMLLPLLIPGYSSEVPQELPDSVVIYPMSIYLLVVAMAGAVLCATVDSAVPLKWCFGLGVVCALLLLVSVRVTEPGEVGVFTAYLVAVMVIPVVSGWAVKKSRRT